MVCWDRLAANEIPVAELVTWGEVARWGTTLCKKALPERLLRWGWSESELLGAIEVFHFDQAPLLRADGSRDARAGHDGIQRLQPIAVQARDRGHRLAHLSQQHRVAHIQPAYAHRDTHATLRTQRLLFQATAG